MQPEDRNFNLRNLKANQNKTQLNQAATSGYYKQKITREITQAGTSTTRGHFGCIFKATADCAT
jgi:hypothetical protein